MNSAKIDRVAQHLREIYPHAVATGTYRHIFQRHDRATNIAETPDGPPVFLDGGVAAGSYTYRPDSTTLTAEEYAALCAILDAPETTGPGPEDRARDRRERAMYGRTLTAEDRRRNTARARAWGQEGNKYV